MGLSTDTSNQLRHDRQYFTFFDEDVSTAVSPRTGLRRSPGGGKG